MPAPASRAGVTIGTGLGNARLLIANQVDRCPSTLRPRQQSLWQINHRPFLDLHLSRSLRSGAGFSDCLGDCGRNHGYGMLCRQPTERGEIADKAVTRPRGTGDQRRGCRRHVVINVMPRPPCAASVSAHLAQGIAPYRIRRMRRIADQADGDRPFSRTVRKLVVMAARAGLEACLAQSEGHDGGRGVIYLTASADAMKTGTDFAGRLGERRLAPEDQHLHRR